ncbi:magnesium/cobalt transporter CorA [Candidatus Peregrinibacteria bacterium]|nr:magnesium/cobalt transporter CorA [Candidatus Peregrinibacteria bacterium]
MINKPVIEKIKNKEKNFTWVSINNLDEKAALYLKKNYKFHHLDIEDCFSKEVQRPKIDEYDEYLFIILNVPVKQGKRKLINSLELNIFIGQNFVITVHKDLPLLKDLFAKCKKNKKTKEEYMGLGSGYFLYMIIDDLFEDGFPLLDDLYKQLNELEIDVFEVDYSRDRLKDILLLKKDIINFRRIIMPQRAIIAQLEHKNKKFLPEKLDVYFDDIVDKIEKIWNNLENLQELAVSLQETNESIISHNTNNVIKILTIFSVIMLPLTFITGFYGMNINNLPLAQHPLSLPVITGILVAIAVIMVSYFRYRRWL